MRILQLSNRVPWPARDGGAIAMLRMTEGMKEAGCDVHLLALNTRKHHADMAKLPPEFTRLAKVEAVDINTDLSPVGALLNLFSSESYHLSRFRSADFDEKLKVVLQQNDFDVVHFEGLHITVYLPLIRKYTKAKCVLRAHNLEFLIWERYISEIKNPLKKLYLKLMTSRLRRYELELINSVDGIVAITEHDAKLFRELGAKVPIHVTPTGIDPQGYVPDQSKTQWPSLFHFGSLDWLPNEQGVKWFLDEVWPKVHAQSPDVPFTIAGRRLPDWVKNLRLAGVRIQEDVPDSLRFINEQGVMLVPLHSGSGMRIKILEGMAMAKPIVSTSIGAEGIHCTDGQDILLADTAEGFAGAIGKLLSDKEGALAIGRKARGTAERYYDNKRLVGKMVGFYEELKSSKT